MRYLAVLFTTLFLSCQTVKDPAATHIPVHDTFGDYWYDGLAEITTYDLRQARYGEIRGGHATLIFVTEDFSASRQVKLDDPARAESDVLKVLKLNKTKKFNTGIYPYSLMTSVFSPVGGDPHAVKLTTSSQEWCGHSWLQMNRADERLQVNGYSYFESEGDVRFSLENAWLEDGLWNLLRLNPEGLPTGSIDVIPSGFYLRLKHREVKPYAAEAVLNMTDSIASYTISYPRLERLLTIRFEPKAPFAILAWEESYPDGGEVLRTLAERRESKWIDYWNRNANADSVLRDSLGLR